TTRQMGGALGVALIGSLLASVYRGDVRTGLTAAGVPEAAVAKASSPGQAGGAVSPPGAPGPRGRFPTAAPDAFRSGSPLGLLVPAGITLTAAAGVFLWLPARATAADDATVPVDADLDVEVDDAEVAVA